MHDHADAWSALRRARRPREPRTLWKARRRRQQVCSYAEVRLSSVTTGSQGKVDLVPPKAIHAEQGGPTRSVAIIVLQPASSPAEGTVVLQAPLRPRGEDRG